MGNQWTPNDWKQNNGDGQPSDPASPTDSQPASENKATSYPFEFARRHPKWAIAGAVVALLFFVSIVINGSHSTSVVIKPASSSVMGWNGDSPNIGLTPGSVFASVSSRDVCKTNYAASVHDVSSKTRQAVFSAYGITDKKTQTQYQLEYVVPIGLGGDNTAKNLWPLSLSANAAASNAVNALGSHLHGLVCSGQVELPTAQNAMEGNLDDATSMYANMQIGSPIATTTTSSTDTTSTTVASGDVSTTQTTTAPVVASAPTTTAAPSGSNTSASGNGYINTDGNYVPSPVAAPSPPAGATAQCGDGTYSFSQHHSGTCSGHNGVARWL